PQDENENSFQEAPGVSPTIQTSTTNHTVSRHRDEIDFHFLRHPLACGGPPRVCPAPAAGGREPSTRRPRPRLAPRRTSFPCALSSTSVVPPSCFLTSCWRPAAGRAGPRAAPRTGPAPAPGRAPEGAPPAVATPPPPSTKRAPAVARRTASAERRAQRTRGAGPTLTSLLSRREAAGRRWQRTGPPRSWRCAAPPTEAPSMCASRTWT